MVDKLKNQMNKALMNKLYEVEYDKLKLKIHEEMAKEK